MKKGLITIILFMLILDAPALALSPIELSNLVYRAENNDHQAQFILAEAYFNGIDLPRDYEKAFEWMEKAASGGNVMAQNNLANIYDVGIGVARDPHKAASWYRKAAEQGYITSQHSLALMYLNCKGTEQDFANAFFWFSQAANQGHLWAQYNLGTMYMDGLGTPQNYEKAFYWLTRAAEGDFHTGALYNVGVMYYYGRGITQDYTLAREAFEKAAEKKDTEAQIALSIMYQHGLGVHMNLEEAYKWLAIAYVLSPHKTDSPLPAAIGKLANSMSKSQIEVGQAHANKWLMEHP